MLTPTTTIEPVLEANETQAPMPIRIIRKRNDRFGWVVLASEAEKTEAERRAAYVAAFNPCGAA